MILWGRIRRLAFRLAPLSATLLQGGCDWAVLDPKGPIADGNAMLLVEVSRGADTPVDSSNRPKVTPTEAANCFAVVKPA